KSRLPLNDFGVLHGRLHSVVIHHAGGRQGDQFLELARRLPAGAAAVLSAAMPTGFGDRAASAEAAEHAERDGMSWGAPFGSYRRRQNAEARRRRARPVRLRCRCQWTSSGAMLRERAAPPSGADCPIGIVRVSHWSAAVSGGARPVAE